MSIICCIFVLRKKKYNYGIHNSQPKILGTYGKYILL